MPTSGWKPAGITKIPTDALPAVFLAVDAFGERDKGYGSDRGESGCRVVGRLRHMLGPTLQCGGP
jgi:hypothetical protein